MRVTTDFSLAPYNINNDPAVLVQYLLDAIAQTVGADYAIVVGRGDDRRGLSRIAETPTEHEDAYSSVETVLKTFASAATPSSAPEVLDGKGLRGTGFRSAVLFPLSMPDDMLGALGIFAVKADAFDSEALHQIAPSVGLVRLALENMTMYNVMAQNMIVTQSIQLAAREIADNPSPQHIVNILRDYFFDAHVTSCALLLFGPVRDDLPNGPFDYMEVRGTWSKRRGSGVAVGVRFYLNNLTDLLERLEEDEILVFERAKDIRERLDPLLRAFLQAERVRSVTLLGLHANSRKLGVLFVGTDKRHEFTPQELHSYRTVSEFLAINVMTQMLQMQHDRVQQGRAALLDAVTDGVIMVLPSHSGARVLTVNQRFIELFELPSGSYQDWSLADLLDRLPFAEAQRQELRKTWLAIPVRDPSSQKGEFHLINNDGHPVDIEWYSAPVYQDQQVLGRIYTFHDVTAERMAQRLRSAFLSRVSHELRTPLTSIRGFAEFILEATGDKLPDLAREYTEIILSSAKHLNRVFTDMIEITRADAGELKLNRGDAFMPDIIIDVVARMELMYKERKQQVVMELDDDLPPVWVDIDRMIQVLQNLMTNAIKYAPASSTIHISTSHITTEAELPPGAPDDVILPAVMVTVADEGKGLTREQAEKVFMPFYRTDDAKQQKIEGVGLGLAVTRSIVEMHRGKIWAEPNRKGREGGMFVFTIPTLERAQESEPRA